MLFFKKKEIINEQGFTLIEVMVAVAVLSIGLVGGLTAITKNLSIISSGEDRIIAANLAAEGIELVRNVRDTNWLEESPANWNLNIEGSNPSNETIKFFCGDFSHMQIPSSPLTLVACGEDCRVYVHTKTVNPWLGTKCYSDNFNIPNYARVATNFYRLITLDNDSSTDHIIVKVQIKWSEGSQNKYLTAEETLYNWK